MRILPILMDDSNAWCDRESGGRPDHGRSACEGEGRCNQQNNPVYPIESNATL